MKKHTPIETRYHIHRRRVVGFAILFMVCWCIFEGTAYANADNGISPNYLIVLWLDTWLRISVVSTVISSCVVLSVSILTRRSIGWALRATTPLLAIIWVTIWVRDNERAFVWMLFFCIGTMFVALIHRCFARHRNALGHDAGTVTLYSIAVVAYITVIALMSPYFMMQHGGIQDHVETARLHGDTYHLAQVLVWDCTQTEHQYRMDTVDCYLAQNQGFALFRCDSWFGPCDILHRSRLAKLDYRPLDLLIEDNIITVQLGDTLFTYDPSEQ